MTYLVFSSGDFLLSFFFPFLSRISISVASQSHTLSFLSACLRHIESTLCSITFTFFPFLPLTTFSILLLLFFNVKTPSTFYLFFLSFLLLSIPRALIVSTPFCRGHCHANDKVIETLPSDLLKPGLQPARLLHLCSIIQAPFLPGLAEDAHCCHSLFPRLTLREPF